jgi:IS605 OrfB family transposase
MARLGDVPAAQLPRLAGLDFGVNNVVALSFSTGNKAQVVCGKALERIIEAAYATVEDWQSNNTSDRMRELQAQKTALQKDSKKLDMAKHRELNGLLAAMYAEPEYHRLVEKRENIIQNALHQLSHALVSSCQAKRIDVMVVGRNKGWKNACSMDKTQRSRFGKIAHARLLTMLRYKAEEAGIAVITTEESYTSAASFVDNAPLKAAPKANTKATSFLLINHRSQEDRNWFLHPARSDRWARVQADVNGAFNMLRKVFKNFCYSDRLTLKFTRCRLSASRGFIMLQDSKYQVG